MAKLKEYKVLYEIKTYYPAKIIIEAENEEEAEEEFNRILCGDEPKYDENAWIDVDTIYDVEWVTDVVNVEEE